MAKRIMIVHRAAFMRMYLENTLKKLGYEVTSKLELGKIAEKANKSSFIVNEDFIVNEEIVPAYMKQKPHAVLMDSFIQGDQITAKILKADRNAVIVGCSVELHETGNPHGFKREQKKMLDAGAKATIGLDMAPRFAEELKKVLENVL